MKKRYIVPIAVVATILLLCFGIGELAGMFPWQYISESKVETFIEDSRYTFAYGLPENTGTDEYKSVLTDEVAAQIAASTYTVRNDFDLEEKNDAYLIDCAALETEISGLFLEDYKLITSENTLLTKENDNCLVHLKNIDESEMSCTIVDAEYGLVGSEPTTITVHYTNGDEECDLTYYLTKDKASPYTFVVTDIAFVSDDN